MQSLQDGFRLFCCYEIVPDCLQLRDIIFHQADIGRSAGIWSDVDSSAVGFAEFLWSVAGSLSEIVAEGWGVPETAGECCFCDGAGGRTEKLGCHLEAVFQEILFWGGVFMFHEDSVKIGTVDSYVVCHV